MKRDCYYVEGDCILYNGGVMYDVLDDMSEEAKQRLAEIHNEHPDWHWEQAAEVLAAEGLYPVSEVEFPTPSHRLADRPVFLVPTVPFEDDNHRGTMARGMDCGGATAVYHTDRSQALVVASRTLASYYRKRRYARLAGHTVYQHGAPGFPHLEWWDHLEKNDDLPSD